MIIDIPNFEFDINYIELYNYNPLLTDLSEENLKQIAREYFGFEYMEETDEIPTYPVHGIILPPYNRCIVPMICRVKNCVGIKTLFLVDSGSSANFYSKNLIEKLTSTSKERFREVFYVHSTKRCVGACVMVSPEDSYFSGVNILGSRYLSLSRKFSADFKTNTCKIECFE